jgi:hypothetical protein
VRNGETEDASWPKWADAKSAGGNLIGLGRQANPRGFFRPSGRERFDERRRNDQGGRTTGRAAAARRAADTKCPTGPMRWSRILDGRLRIRQRPAGPVRPTFQGRTRNPIKTNRRVGFQGRRGGLRLRSGSAEPRGAERRKRRAQVARDFASFASCPALLRPCLRPNRSISSQSSVASS